MKNWSLKQTVYIWLRRLNALVLSVILAVQLASCGPAKQPSDSSEGKWGYVPEFIDFDEEDVTYNDIVFSEDSLYYLSQGTEGEVGISGLTLCKYSLTDGQLAGFSLPFETEEGSAIIRQVFTVAEDGSIYLLTCMQPTSEDLNVVGEVQWQLDKFNQNGNKLFSKDVTSRMDTGYTCCIMTDARGYLYFGSGSSVWRYDADGNEQGSISQEQIPEEVSAGGACGLKL